MNIWTKLAMYSFYETERLYFRPFFFTDVDDFHAIASDPENLQFIFLHKPALRKANMLLLTTL